MESTVEQGMRSLRSAELKTVARSLCQRRLSSSRRQLKEQSFLRAVVKIPRGRARVLDQAKEFIIAAGSELVLITTILPQQIKG